MTLVTVQNSTSVDTRAMSLNLSVNSFLFIMDSENLENKELNTREVREQLKLIKKWRVLGPLGMLHNFIVYFQASP